ncbi:hypothetical protein MBOL_01710 [Mycobacteroides abscessus subsp. bolletii BD]|nr:hypothetical protein MBOL_01710 [Mycobacteroides abscessus subsp. bolletii BD]
MNWAPALFSKICNELIRIPGIVIGNGQLAGQSEHLFI